MVRKLFLLGALLVYLSFYIPLGLSSPWSKFFPPGYLHHGARGMDFYQVPEGARSLLKGHSISGEGLDAADSFTEGEFTNRNVYHPAITLTVGGFLQLFSKEHSQLVWHLLKLVTSLGAVLWLLRKYRHSPYKIFASCLFFLNVVHFNEIHILQYQSVANVLLLLFLYAGTNNRFLLSAGSLALCLIVKPFFLFGILVHGARQRDWRWVATVGGLVALLTVPFLFCESAGFFFTNIFQRIWGGSVLIQANLISIQSVLSMYGISTPILKSLQWTSIALLMMLSFDKRYTLPTVTLFSLIIWLSFDQLVYEYHFSTISCVLFFGVLSQRSWQTKSALILSALSSLPNLYVVLHACGVEMQGDGHMMLQWWGISVVLRFLPLVCLAIYLLWRESVDNREERAEELSIRDFLNLLFEFFWGSEEEQAVPGGARASSDTKQSDVQLILRELQSLSGKISLLEDRISSVNGRRFLEESPSRLSSGRRFRRVG